MSGISSLGGMSSGMVRSFTPPSFSSLDSNSDGGITLEEMQSNAPGGVSNAQSASRAAELFSKMDSDGDGTVTSSEKDAFDTELEARMSEMQFSTQLMASGESSGAPSTESLVSSILSALDTDSDGSVSLSELSDSSAVEGLDSNSVSTLFSTLDSDGSGSVSSDELSSFMEEYASAGAPPPGPPPGPPPSSDGGEDTSVASSDGVGGAGGPPPGGAPPSEDDSTTYDPLDTNEDGTVSLEERLAAYGNTQSDSTTAALNALSSAIKAYASSSSSLFGDAASSFAGLVDAAA